VACCRTWPISWTARCGFTGRSRKIEKTARGGWGGLCTRPPKWSSVFSGSWRCASIRAVAKNKQQTSPHIRIQNIVISDLSWSKFKPVLNVNGTIAVRGLKREPTEVFQAEEEWYVSSNIY
jgi:hypothetical protein